MRSGATLRQLAQHKISSFLDKMGTKPSSYIRRQTTSVNSRVHHYCRPFVDIVVRESSGHRLLLLLSPSSWVFWRRFVGGAALRPTCPLAPSYATAFQPTGWSVEINCGESFPRIGPIQPSSRAVLHIHYSTQPDRNECAFISESLKMPASWPCSCPYLARVNWLLSDTSTWPNCQSLVVTISSYSM